MKNLTCAYYSTEREASQMLSLVPIEHYNQRVLTTKQLAEFYETETRRIAENYSANKDRYYAGPGNHYFSLCGDELKDFKNRYGISVVAENANGLYLWTEKGALLHAKSLNTDKAWEVYQELVDTYFRVQQALKPMTQAEIIAASAQQLVEIERKVLTLDSKITNALDIFTTPAKDDWRQEMPAE
jgi:hypothetical protein